MAKRNKKPPKAEFNIAGGKEPRIRENPESYFGWKPSWCFSKCDFQHEKWSLQKAPILEEIIPKLIMFESRTWGEIVSDKKHNHWIDVEEFSKPAQERMMELNLYYDSLFSLRLTGKLRLFGYIENGVFYIIWYDPEHEICPATLKHT